MRSYWQTASPMNVTEQQKRMTAEEFLRRPDDGNRYELIEGVLTMMSPVGGDHCEVVAAVTQLLRGHVKQNRLGKVYAGEPGFLLARDPDTVRAPDVAFVSDDRLAKLTDTSGFLETSPDLAVEVISPSDSFSYVEEKARMWLDAGTRMVLLVDPASRTVYVYRGSGRVATLSEQDTLDAGEAVPGWKVPVREFFG
jgi:Uma2 family endonuclease